MTSANLSGGNPFSPMAVARVTDSEAITVETDAVREAQRHLSTFLEPDPGQVETTAAGNVVAVVGDYGTGKTHLAVLMRRRAGRGQLPVEAIYIDSTADNFVAIYERVIRKLTLEGLQSRINADYADVVADSLEGTGLTDGIGKQLRERQVDPGAVVHRLKLMESELQRKTRERWQSSISSRDFIAALDLLLRRQSDEDVWAWLTGGPIAPVLRERGITERIDTDTKALAFLGHLARLYGGPRHRFLLLLDEADKMLVADRPDLMAALKTLLEVFVSSGAMLVLFGLPDFTRSLSEDVRRRIGSTVRMTPLGTSDVIEFIRRSTEAASGTERLEPFTEPTVDLMVTLAKGNPRMVIKMCHRLHQTATELRSSVDQSMVRAQAPEYISRATLETIASDVENFLSGRGWRYHETVHDDGIEVQVRFVEPQPGCTVVIHGPVVSDKEKNVLLRRATALRSDHPDSALVLVTSGSVAAHCEADLSTAFEDGVVSYEAAHFPADIDRTFTAISARHGQIGPAMSTAVLDTSLREISAQQTTLVAMLARQEDDRRLVHHRLIELLRYVRPTGARQAAASPTDQLPDRLARLFTECLDLVDEVGRWPEVTAALSTTGSVDIERVLDQIRDAPFRSAIGLASLIRNIVVAFRAAVVDWVDTAAVPPQPDQMYLLERVCLDFDAVAVDLTLFLSGVGHGDQARWSELERRVSALGTRVLQQVTSRDDTGSTDQP